MKKILTIVLLLFAINSLPAELPSENAINYPETTETSNGNPDNNGQGNPNNNGQGNPNNNGNGNPNDTGNGGNGNNNGWKDPGEELSLNKYDILILLSMSGLYNAGTSGRAGVGP